MARKDSRQTKAPGPSSALASGQTKKPASPARSERALLGCFRRRQIWLPTWRGLLLGLIVVSFIFVGGLFSIHPFLSPTHPVSGGILVVEGWGPDYAMQAAIDEFRRGHYDRLYVTGGPLEHGGPLSDFQSFAELGAATIEKLGLSTNQVQAVPAPLVQQDRTYNSALALRRYLDEHAIAHPSINLISIGPHARRSRLLYIKVFSSQTPIGILAIKPRDYDPKRWWRSSAGVRTVLSEVFAYVYVRFFFRASTEAVTNQ